MTADVTGKALGPSVDDDPDERDDLGIPRGPRGWVRVVDMVDRIVRGTPSANDLAVGHAHRPCHPRDEDVYEEGRGPGVTGPARGGRGLLGTHPVHRRPARLIS